MIYRTKTYLAGDWDGDRDAIDRLYLWNESKYWSLHFSDAHELTQSRDTSLKCSIKRKLVERLNASKRFVLIVGEKTKRLTNGSCYTCWDYSSGLHSCTHGYTLDSRSYIEFECERAKRDELEIVVLYNSTIVNRAKCPEVLSGTGVHVAMKRWGDRGAEWDYESVRDALM